MSVDGEQTLSMSEIAQRAAGHKLVEVLTGHPPDLRSPWEVMREVQIPYQEPFPPTALLMQAGRKLLAQCRDCKHFIVSSSFPEGYPYKGWGECSRVDFDYGFDDNEPPTGALAVTGEDDHGSGSLYVSPDFGCKMFEVKEMGQ